MLIQLVIENFLSFRDKVVLNLTVSPAETHHEDRVRRTTPDGARLLNCAALYGANASGKSNLVRAVQFARELILKGTQLEDSIKVQRFKLHPAMREEPSRFEFEIAYLEREYSYGFIVTETEVKAEWLYVRDSNGERMLFERGPDNPAKPSPSQILLGEAITQARHGFVGYVAQGTRPNQLFLTEAALRNVDEVNPLIEWFKNRLVILDPDPNYLRHLIRRVENEPALLKFLGSLVSRADTGIDELILTKEAATDKTLNMQISAAARWEKWENGKGLNSLEVLRSLLDSANLKLNTRHRDSVGNSVDFELDEESDGTLRLLNLAPLLYDVEHSPESRQTVYLIDELDRSLHPLLTRLYLKSFLEIDPEHNHGQLIFTTHDTNLLNLDLLRSDEIWFVEKDREKASNLYSLAEFKPEQLDELGADIERGYLNGRFGAIPFFGDITRLGWKQS